MFSLIDHCDVLGALLTTRSLCVVSVQNLLRELKDLKGQFPPAERSATWARLKEESDMRRIIKNAEKWLTQAHQAEARRMPIRRVKALVESSEIGQVNVETEVVSTWQKRG